MREIEERLDELEIKIQNPSFRKNSGLGNEVGYYIFDYRAEDERIVRERIAYIEEKSNRSSDEFTKTKGNDFSKIQGRFDTRLSLSSANADEVIRKRILLKTSIATSALSAMYDEKATIKSERVYL